MRAVLDARLEAFRVRYGLPGASAAITFPDGTTWLGSVGLADVAGGRPMTTDTAFGVASISKTFTAALVVALADDDLLVLDAPVVRYLPQSGLDPAITVRELLDHTSGLADFFYHPKIDAALLAHPELPWTAADSLRFVGKPYFKPGIDWAYSNTNYVVLGMLAEAVGGEPVADQLRKRFFKPLHLDHTFYQAVEKRNGPIAHAYRFEGAKNTLPPIDLSDGSDIMPFTSVVTAAGAAGSIASTAEDLAHWARALYDGRALDQGSAARMLADVGLTARFKPAIGYGLGVQAVVVDGHRTYGHSGRLLGTRAVMRWLPDDGIAIAILTNQSRTDPNLLLRLLLPAVVGQPSDCATCPVRR
jgi:D-alanyl-D-alanine carboxypeptidase